MNPPPVRDPTETFVGEDFVVAPASGGMPCLVVLKGVQVGHSFTLQKSNVVIGRDDTVDIPLLDDRISRKHARLVVEGDTSWIEDLGSRNGTFVNGERISGRHSLRDGDKIQLGARSIVRFSLHDELDASFQRELLESALCDPLTQVYNRRFFLDRLESEFRFALRHRSHLSVVMIDVDHFKRINDTYGHVIGDAMLVEVANAVKPAVRAEDVFARYGGEEFVLLCRASDADQTEIVAERVRQRVAEQQLQSARGVVSVTISLGIATFPELAVENPIDLLTAADAALYAAKNAGRNRVRRAGVGPDGPATR
jgi:two-component system, cell cycle response regulator